MTGSGTSGEAGYRLPPMGRMREKERVGGKGWVKFQHEF